MRWRCITRTTTPQRSRATLRWRARSTCFKQAAPIFMAIRYMASNRERPASRARSGSVSSPHAIGMPPGELLVEVRGVTKDYRGLRPLRLQQLDVHQGKSVALIGFDLAMAEVLVNLITGAQLPDTGEVRVLGRPTSAIENATEWMCALDQFGLISERAVLL